MMKIKKLLEPIPIKNLSINNRIVMPAMALVFTQDRSFSDSHQGFYIERANGGVGLMILGPFSIDKACMPFVPGLFEDKYIIPIYKFVKKLHKETEAKIGIQLMQQGAYASSRNTGIIPIAPSAIYYKIPDEIPREMTKADIEETKRNYVKAALRAKETGVDYIEILAGGGYLIGEFLSPLTNHREDEYGGSIENRTRFGLEVINDIRKALGKDFVIGIRVSGHDYMAGGNTISESAYFCREAEKSGIDAINVTGGWHETNVPQLPSEVPSGTFLYLARAIKEEVEIPVFASNRLGDPYVAERALRSGVADMICWGRPLIADPELPNKVRTDRMDQVISCIGCNVCLDALFAGSNLCCTMNPRAGRELQTKVMDTSLRKKIFVAGAGPAGMEFSLIAQQRGHDVTLFEKNEEVGGQINLIEAIPGKHEFLNAVKSLKRQCENAGVKIKYHTSLSANIVKNNKPDILVIATGAIPSTLNIIGINQANVVNAWDVLSGTVFDLGKRVVIIGGGATGCETALYIANMTVPTSDIFKFLVYHTADDLDSLRKLLYYSGRKIHIIEVTSRLAQDVGLSTRWLLLKNLRLMGITMLTERKILQISGKEVIVETNMRNKEVIVADTIIVAVGTKSNNTLTQEVSNRKTEVLIIGDAKRPGKIKDAIRDGFEAAIRL